MLCMLNDEGVENLVVDAHALAAHGYPRATGDIDLWVRSIPERVPQMALRFRGLQRSGTSVVVEPEQCHPAL
jgi:hypothetical protein